MTIVGAGKESTSGFQRRGTVFRNVVIICSLLTGCLLVAGYLILRSMLKEVSERDLPWDTVAYSLVPLGLLAIVQVLPRGAWRWVGLGALVFAGVCAFMLLLGLPALADGLAQLFRGEIKTLLLFPPALVLSGLFTGALSWLYLGRYCRAWAREFAAAKAASSGGVQHQESARKETV